MIARTLCFWLVLCCALIAGDVSALPRDAAKESWVRTALASLGLNNEIRVVREEGLTKGSVCAYATISGGRQYVAYDPQCLTTLTHGEPNYFWCAGTMFHEIAHHLTGATAVTGKSTMEWESEADRWAGWAFRYSGATLDQAMLYARAPQTLPDHPSTTERIRLVESGWRMANAIISGGGMPKPLPASSGGAVEKLAGAARRGLKTLRETTSRP